MGDSIHFRVHLLPWIISGIVVLGLLFLTGGLPGCGDFTLWEEKSTLPDDGDDDDDDDTTISCDIPFPGLGAFTSGNTTQLDATYVLSDPVAMAIAPAGMAFTLDSISVEEGDVLLVDKGTTSTNGKIVAYTYSAEENSSAQTLIAEMDNPEGIFLVHKGITGLPLYNDALLYSVEEAGAFQINGLLLDSDFGGQALITETIEEPIALTFGESGENSVLFVLDKEGTQYKIYRTDGSIAEIYLKISMGGSVTPIAILEESNDTLYDFAFSSQDGSLYVLSSSGVYKLTDAVTRTDTTLPPALISSSAFNEATPAAITLAYSNDEADAASLLVMFSVTTNSDIPQIIEFDLGEDPPTEIATASLLPNGVSNSLNDIAYDCKNGRLLMTNNPSGSGALYEVNPVSSE